MIRCLEVVKRTSKSFSTLSARRRILHDLSDELTRGRWGPDEPLPSENELCRQYGVSRMTIRQRLAELEQRGLIYRIQGKGTFARPQIQLKAKPVAILFREPWKIGRSHMSDVITGAQSALAARGSYLTIISSTPGEWPVEFTQLLAGVLVVPRLVTANDLAVLNRLKIRYMVSMESELPGPAVRMDLEEAARELVRGLLELGHRRFALLSGHFEHGDGVRKRGIAQELEAAGIPFKSVPDYCTNYDAAVARSACGELLERTDRPTAIVAFDDELALHALQVAQGLGMQAPRDLSIVGFNDAAFTTAIEPQLTTVRLMGVEGARRAAEQLCDAALSGQEITDVVVGHEVLWRQSTGPAPGVVLNAGHINHAV